MITWQSDPVKFIKTAPQPAHTETLKNLRTVQIRLLVRTIRYDDKNSKGPTQVLNCLCFTRPCRAGWSPTKEHSEGLSKGDVSPVSEGRDYETFLCTKILKLIVEIYVRYANNCSAYRVRGSTTLFSTWTNSIE